MSDTQPKTIYLKDYKVPPFLIGETKLRFELGEAFTLVKSELHFRKNPDSKEKEAPLSLNGVELELVALSIDGSALDEKDYLLEGERLIINKVPDQFVLNCETRIYPQNNTCLEGLYKSSSLFCTQCEAEGFRRITFYLDRPDVMAKFTTTIVADQKAFPILLSNGNKVEEGAEEDGRHYAVWQDPFPKPCYLFALVAGDLVEVVDQFTTVSGRDVAIKMYVDSSNKNKCAHALDSLKRAMRWDEKTYGREYDLDIFMIVAVDDFNMGAMENKGLNIFNSSCVLASSETATDATWQRIEGIVAHEYFHNWSGDRVTCRDWFQLSLKEGFTVFRDAGFSADMNSEAVKRIEDVNLLRTAQFSEDAGPMAHPIRPASFMEISNFYTLTIYEKGAEVVGMIKTLLGADNFRKGSDLYFQRHDGQAVTTDDFVAAMEDASGQDLTQFKNWYSQAGTPRVHVSDVYDAAKQQYSLTFTQSCSPSPGQDEKKPFHIPVALGLLDAEGKDLELVGSFECSGNVIALTEPTQTFIFENVMTEPTPSLLRGFSAPVKLHFDYSAEQLNHLAMHDSDQFNRWNAGQLLAENTLSKMIDSDDGLPQKEVQYLIDIYASVIEDLTLDGSIKSKMLSLPSVAYLIEISENVDVDKVHRARTLLLTTIISALSDSLIVLYGSTESSDDYNAQFTSIARRELRNTVLALLTFSGVEASKKLACDQFSSASNMTDEAGALRALVNSPFQPEIDQVLEQFYVKWQSDVQVMELWLAVQSGSPVIGKLSHVLSIIEQSIFDITNPNKVRSVIGAFCNQSLVHFHDKSGNGYRFLADKVIELNLLNPQIASRLVTPLTHWKKFEEGRKALMKSELERILSEQNLSRDLYEVVSKSLKNEN